LQGTVTTTSSLYEPMNRCPYSAATIQIRSDKKLNHHCQTAIQRIIEQESILLPTLGRIFLAIIGLSIFVFFENKNTSVLQRTLSTFFLLLYYRFQNFVVHFFISCGRYYRQSNTGSKFQVLDR
jgi:hypothetical protein